jgi:glutamate-1-semialdehyde aminotransferase
MSESKTPRGAEYIAQGCCTYSKRKDQYVEGVYPVYYEDMNAVDFVCGLGSNLIGWHNNYALPSKLEPELAYRLHELFPFMEKMKFLKTGSAACEAAVRIARARKPGQVIGFGYHGCSNIFIAEEKPGSGTAPEGYSKVDGIKSIIEILRNHTCPMVSAVILEPVMLDMNVKDELIDLRKACTENDVCLIFDEIITGFRVPKYCIANYFGVIPDIICLGKALGNGHPIAIVGGKAEYMETPGYFISNTHNGETDALRQSLFTLDMLKEPQYSLDKFWESGEIFQRRLNQIIEPLGIELYGIPTRATWRGDEKNKALFWQEMLDEGFFFGKAWFLNFSHAAITLLNTLNHADIVTKRIMSGAVELRGQPPRELFKRY